MRTEAPSGVKQNWLDVPTLVTLSRIRVFPMTPGFGQRFSTRQAAHGEAACSTWTLSSRRWRQEEGLSSPKAANGNRAHHAVQPARRLHLQQDADRDTQSDEAGNCSVYPPRQVEGLAVPVATHSGDGSLTDIARRCRYAQCWYSDPHACSPPAMSRHSVCLGSRYRVSKLSIMKAVNPD